MVGRFAFALLLGMSTASCGDSCMRDGCDALQRRAAGSSTGIAGVIASQSDVVENGCAECGFADATIEAYELTSAVSSDADASAVVRDTSPIQTVEASEQYALSLAPGSYLVCVHDGCIDAVVEDGSTTTINVKLRYGPPGFFVVDASGGGIAESFGFDVTGARD